MSVYAGNNAKMMEKKSKRGLNWKTAHVSKRRGLIEVIIIVMGDVKGHGTSVCARRVQY